jgi:hypothetical protein
MSRTNIIPKKTKINDIKYNIMVYKDFIAFYYKDGVEKDDKYHDYMKRIENLEKQLERLME